MNNPNPRRLELLTLTVRREAATVFTSGPAAADMLARARADFPNYKLKLAEVDGGTIIATDGMRVQRWVRV